MGKIIDTSGKSALIGGFGAGVGIIFLQSFIPFGPLGLVLATSLFGYVAFKIFDSAFG